MHIAIVTAGGAGMFCGSCMHDNTWARSMTAAGAQVSLIPTYTPIHVDEQDVSMHRVFLGGINVYMEFRSRLWRRLPRMLTRWLDWPEILKVATRWGVNSDARKLGGLTVAMLKGEAGLQRTDVEELADFLAAQLKPDLICFSNILLSGVIGSLKRQFAGPLFCLLQGDDVFLSDLPEPFQSQSLELIKRHGRQFDGFLVHSDYYRDFMSDYLSLPREKFHRLPLGIDLQGHDGQPGETTNEVFTIGYFARICPEKGLHQLVDAFRMLHQRHPNTRLRVGGYLGKRDAGYFREQARAAAEFGLDFQYIGSPTSHAEKVEFLKSLDVLSVPTVYHEPKGIYVLEANANGVPVVQPRHGAFPELLEATGGGLLVKPDDPADLARGLEELLLDPTRRLRLGQTGQNHVRAHFDLKTMAEASLKIFNSPVA